jgi:hypothetical protein
MTEVPGPPAVARRRQDDFWGVAAARRPSPGTPALRRIGRAMARLPLPGWARARTSRPGRVLRRHATVPVSIRRRRAVFGALLLLNAVELAGVLLVGPGFWIGFSVSFAVLLADVAYLRWQAVADARLRRARQRRQAWLAAEQAAIRQEHERRAAQRYADESAGMSGLSIGGYGGDHTASRWSQPPSASTASASTASASASAAKGVG